MTDDSTLTTQRLRLLPVAREHAQAIWAIHSDPRTNAHNPSGPMTDCSEAEEQARAWAADWSNSGQGYWAVEQAGAAGTVIGFGGIRLQPWQGRQAYNLYYRFSPDAWGKGYAAELVDATVQQWQAAETPAPLIARTTDDNIASQRTAIRGGLVRRPEFNSPMGSRTRVVFALGLE